MREKYSITIELHENILILKRIKIMKEHITEKYIKVCNKRINRIVQGIRENVDNGAKIWKLKMIFKRKSRHHIP